MTATVVMRDRRATVDTNLAPCRPGTEHGTTCNRATLGCPITHRDYEAALHLQQVVNELRSRIGYLGHLDPHGPKVEGGEW